MTSNGIGKAGLLVLAASAIAAGAAEIKKRGETSYFPVAIKEPFASIFKRMTRRGGEAAPDPAAEPL